MSVSSSAVMPSMVISNGCVVGNIDCGLYHLNVSCNTSALEGWMCGVTFSSGAMESNDTLNHGFNSISCGDGSMLYIGENTTALDGYVCGLTFYSPAPTSVASTVNFRWYHLLLAMFALIQCSL
ncbi:LAFE_0E01332g1_1 [Lachancea fermentati]|uniref:LAFE_0E01332g1_1 n=1 Tax=Lachancea fermentati TaxID=4955 RepID=A0A1G4MC72_LACFM|nr:LAFE_0E01332g1_1 [Lachancea fermentati]